MDVIELVDKKDKLKSDIHELIDTFYRETGYPPEVSIQWQVVQHLGVPEDRFPSVSVILII